MRRLRRRAVGALCALTVLAVLAAPSAQAEATRPRLDDADPYAVIADQSVIAEGAVIVNGNLAIAGTDDLVGFPPGVVNGEVHLADQDALNAAGDGAAANQNLKSQPCNSDRTGEDQADLRLGSAVYCYVESATLTGTLRLDALGDPNAVWVFQIAGNYEVAGGSQILLVNGAQACNVFWQVTGTVDIGPGASVAGTFVSDDDISVDDGGEVRGRLFALQGVVNLDDATVTQSACQATGGQVTTTTTATTTVPTTTTSTPGATPTTTAPTATTAPGTGTGGGDGTGGGTGGTGAGDDGDGGLAATGPYTLFLTVAAGAALALGHALVGSERAVEWNARRWRPRHAESRFLRAKQAAVGLLSRTRPAGRHTRR